MLIHVGDFHLMKSNNTDQNKESVLKCHSHGMPKLPGTSTWMAMIYANGYIFTCGGVSPDYKTSLTGCYKINLATKQLESMKPMALHRFFFYMAYYNSKIFAIGGSTGGSSGDQPRNSVEEYDIASDTWTPYAHSLPISHYRGCLVSINNLVYVIGGLNAAGTFFIFKLSKIVANYSILYTRHWKDHLKNDRRSDQDHRLKLDRRSDQDHPLKNKMIF
jgi:hypothetical protein